MKLGDQLLFKAHIKKPINNLSYFFLSGDPIHQVSNTGETRDKSVIGFHNWIQFHLQEKAGNVDYKGYMTSNKEVTVIGSIIVFRILH